MPYIIVGIKSGDAMETDSNLRGMYNAMVEKRSIKKLSEDDEDEITNIVDVVTAKLVSDGFSVSYSYNENNAHFGIIIGEHYDKKSVNLSVLEFKKLGINYDLDVVAVLADNEE